MRKGIMHMGLTEEDLLDRGPNPTLSVFGSGRPSRRTGIMSGCPSPISSRSGPSPII